MELRDYSALLDAHPDRHFETCLAIREKAHETADKLRSLAKRLDRFARNSYLHLPILDEVACESFETTEKLVSFVLTTCKEVF